MSESETTETTKCKAHNGTADRKHVKFVVAPLFRAGGRPSTKACNNKILTMVKIIIIRNNRKNKNSIIIVMKIVLMKRTIRITIAKNNHNHNNNLKSHILSDTPRLHKGALQRKRGCGLQACVSESTTGLLSLGFRV